jgi:hypothetical protein
LVFFEKSSFHSFFFFPSLHLVLCNYVFDRLVGDFNHLISFLIFVLWLTCFLARFICFLSLAWRCNIAITNSQINARSVVYILNRKPFDDNIYKQWELGQGMVIRLVIDLEELVKVVLKQSGKRCGWVW